MFFLFVGLPSIGDQRSESTFPEARCFFSFSDLPGVGYSNSRRDVEVRWFVLDVGHHSALIGSFQGTLFPWKGDKK